MSQQLTVLVTGATGKQGGAVARLLLRKGHSVRALTRKPDSAAAHQLASLGAQIVSGDLTDRGSLNRALAGTQVAFGMSTPFEAGMQTETQQGITLADAAKEAQVHLVYTSVGSAHRDTGIPHFESKWRVEGHIRDIGLSATIIRPVYFMENLLSWGLPLLREGQIAMPLPPDRKLQQIAVSDIAAFAAFVMERTDRFADRAFDIASDEITGEEAARALTHALGREISYVRLPMETIRKTSEDMALMYEWFDRVGYDVDIRHLRREYRAVQWHTFQAWAKAQDWTSALSPPARPSQRRPNEPVSRHHAV
jgi:uncharacterized protein YbjT (DUF2867 family)